MEADPVPKKRRGRPPGSRNKNPQEREVPPGLRPNDDYRHADPDAIISRQFTLLDWAQQALRNEMKRGMQRKGEHISSDDISKLAELSNAIVRAVDGLKKYDGLADELQRRLSPKQLLEAAIKKIEGQDIPTLNYAIRRLRAYRATLAPVSGPETKQLGDKPNNLTGKNSNAATMIADLEDEDDEV